MDFIVSRSLHLKQWALTEELYTSKHTLILSSYDVTQTFERASTSVALNESLAKCSPPIITLSILRKDEHVHIPACKERRV